MDMKYYKGTLTVSGQRIVVCKYPILQTGLWNRHYIAEAIILENGSHKLLKSDGEVDNLCSIEREISEKEFEFFTALSRLSNEVFLNQYTGGFPCEKTCNRIVNDLPKLLKETIQHQNNKEDWNDE